MDDCIDVKPGSNVEVTLNCDLVASKTKEVDEKLMELIYAQKPSYFIVDMKHVEMVDSSGIGLLLELHNFLNDSQCSMTVINLSADIHDLFLRMRIDTHITLNP